MTMSNPMLNRWMLTDADRAMMSAMEEPAQEPAPTSPETVEVKELTDDELDACTPVPVGFRLLCVVPAAQETFDNSSILKAESVKRSEEFGTTVLYVLDMGPDAYRDEARFPNGPYCKVGDHVLVRTYTGTRVSVHGREYRLINDDQVEAVVKDPRGVLRVNA